MTFLPIVERELRVASRRRGTYLGRLAGAVIAMAIGGWIMLATGNNAPGQMGMILFGALSVMLFFYSLGAGARMTADCLSEEKREGTLGLLFLTDLKGYDIVAGKLVANSLNTFYGLLSAFPVLAIALLMGGVTAGEFWRVTLVAASLLFLSLCAGMFASSICRDERKAMSLAFLILVFLLAAPPLVELGLNIADRHRADTTAWFVFSPGYSCFSAFQRAGFKPSDFWIPVAMTHGYSWIFLVLASSIVPRSWQDKSVRNPIRFRHLWQKIFRTNTGEETARRTKLLNINPFLWLAARDRLQATFIWAVLSVITVLWIWGYVKWPGEWPHPSNYVVTAVILHTILKFWLASEACYRFVEDRKNGALELLLSTPLSVEKVLRGQRLALFRQFGGPALFVLTIDFLFLLMGYHDRDLGSGEERSFWVAIWLCGMGVFIMDLFALSWVSMWTGLTAQKANRASSAAISRILILPWLAFFFSLTLMATANLFSSVNWDGTVVLFYWLTLCVVNNLIFMNWAKRNLRMRFREKATQRFDAKASRFAWFKPRADRFGAEVPPVINLR